MSARISYRPQDYFSVSQSGAQGNNAADNLAAFNAATAYCIAAGKKLVIPRGNFVLSGAWVITAPIDIEMDPSANLRWTNAASAGIVFDFRSAASNYGLNSVRLGGLYSDACANTFTFPGYPSSWNASARSTQDAVTVWGGSRINIEIQYALGWNAAFRPTATYDATNGGRAPNNINFRCNTADINTYGVLFDGGVANAGNLAAIVAEFNTCFAKFPVYYNTSVNGIGECHARITGQAFTNEAGGAVVYDYGSNVNTCDIDVAWAYAGHASDSPSGTSTTLSLPYVAGTSSSNGTSTDGNATLGYWGGSNNRIHVGAAVNLSGLPGGAIPASGIVTRVRDVGVNNEIVVDFYGRVQGAVQALSTTQGEANFNGGVGGASYSRKTLVSIAVPTLANVSAQNFYFYHSMLSAGQNRSVRIEPVDSSIANSKLFLAAKDNSASVNRECILSVTNLSGASVTGATYYAWLVVD